MIGHVNHKNVILLQSNGSASLVELGSGIRGVSLILLVVWGFSA